MDQRLFQEFPPGVNFFLEKLIPKLFLKFSIKSKIKRYFQILHISELSESVFFNATKQRFYNQGEKIEWETKGKTD